MPISPAPGSAAATPEPQPLRMTRLGAALHAPISDGPVATMPIAADSWTMGEADSEGEDAFGTYLQGRRRAD